MPEKYVPSMPMAASASKMRNTAPAMVGRSGFAAMSTGRTPAGGRRNALLTAAVERFFEGANGIAQMFQAGIDLDGAAECAQGRARLADLHIALPQPGRSTEMIGVEPQRRLTIIHRPDELAALEE